MEEDSVNEKLSSCELCGQGNLPFEPIYCRPCGSRIKQNAIYYTVGSGSDSTRNSFCVQCYNEASEVASISKLSLHKKKNDDEIEELWIQCDKCKVRHHQICAMFNGRRNNGSNKAEYTCTNCAEEPLLQGAVLGAADLPRTILSDQIEQRLFRLLKQERQERARLEGKSFDEVQGAESLVVRVVSAVNKKMEVNKQFLEILGEKNYPTNVPYKSKVVLLFQKIEGVEVCLFGMYVREFGIECGFPNQRVVYLSSLDSTQYFRPELRAVTGHSLCTFVYHEIMIGYLLHCKRRGFTSCYIHACPSTDDYIFYCPGVQKTLKPDERLEWYLAMLRKASNENIVVDFTNLFDHFFVPTGESKAKATAAKLPYFDGDYWPVTPVSVEDLIHEIGQEEDDQKLDKKGNTKKTVLKRALEELGHSDLSGYSSKDMLLMHKLAESISPTKEDLIVIHLQHCCNHCCNFLVSGIRWVCNQCKNFQMCDNCYDAEQTREERERHPAKIRDKHTFSRVEINNIVPVDKDEIHESVFLDTRQAFVSFSQRNHYQYDTLRRAKHSSMMILYHLHNPNALKSCILCRLEIETNQGWSCEICPKFDVCSNCCQKDSANDHPAWDPMLNLLVHASQCRSPHCQHPNCRKVKGMFRHGSRCQMRASGGCIICKKMWHLIHLHATACKESSCLVPQCGSAKERLKSLQQRYKEYTEALQENPENR